MVLNIHRNHKAYQRRGEEGGERVWRCGERVWRCGEREIIYLLLHCHHQNFYPTMCRDESHFNVALIVSSNVTRQS